MLEQDLQLKSILADQQILVVRAVDGKVQLALWSAHGTELCRANSSTDIMAELKSVPEAKSPVTPKV